MNTSDGSPLETGGLPDARPLDVVKRNKVLFGLRPHQYTSGAPIGMHRRWPELWPAPYRETPYVSGTEKPWAIGPGEIIEPAKLRAPVPRFLAAESRHRVEVEPFEVRERKAPIPWGAIAVIFLVGAFVGSTLAYVYLHWPVGKY